MTIFICFYSIHLISFIINWFEWTFNSIISTWWCSDLNLFLIKLNIFTIKNNIFEIIMGSWLLSSLINSCGSFENHWHHNGIWFSPVAVSNSGNIPKCPHMVVLLTLHGVWNIRPQYFCHILSSTSARDNFLWRIYLIPTTTFGISIARHPLLRTRRCQEIS